jgi:hypothetical protein
MKVLLCIVRYRAETVSNSNIKSSENDPMPVHRRAEYTTTTDMLLVDPIYYYITVAHNANTNSRPNRHNA